MALFLPISPPKAKDLCPGSRSVQEGGEGRRSLPTHCCPCSTATTKPTSLPAGCLGYHEEEDRSVAEEEQDLHLPHLQGVECFRHASLWKWERQQVGWVSA